MQEDLQELGILNLQVPLSLEVTAEFLGEQGFSQCVVARIASKITLWPLVTEEGPQKLVCIRDNPHTAVLSDGQLHRGLEACKLCVNCLTCATKNTTKDFILNDGTTDPLAGLF